MKTIEILLFWEISWFALVLMLEGGGGVMFMFGVDLCVREGGVFRSCGRGRGGGGSAGQCCGGFLRLKRFVGNL